MARRYRFVAPAEEAQLWARWRAGESLTAISAALARPPGTVYRLVVQHGGVAPRPRRRAARALSLAEREEISRGLAADESCRAIARRLGRAPSTVSREIRRHGGPLDYRAARADRAAWQRARRPKRCRLATHAPLRRVVAAKLRADWAPEQIARWLVSAYPDDPAMRISPETIYRTLYVQARGALKRELTAHLRRGQSLRRARAAAPRGTWGGRLPAMLSIRARPPEVADRAVPGHWEGDLLIGRPGTQIATLVERHSRYVLLVRLPAADARTVAQALARRVRRLPTTLQQSLTWDQGREMAQHRQFTVATDVQVYFCDPRSPWQRGSNENTNGLLRQYLPKGGDFSGLTQRQLDRIALKLNTRPRDTLGWRTPAQTLAAAVATTG